MFCCKGDNEQDSCGDGEKGWTCPGSSGGCHQNPGLATTLSPCHNHGSLSRDVEGSCQSEPRGCQPLDPCPAPSCCPAQRGCHPGKPRRRVEVSPVPPPCPPPVKIHRRPLQQHLPFQHCQEPDSCGKPRRRVEQCPEEDPCPSVTLHPLPRQRRCPCVVPCHPRPIQRCCPVPLPPQLHPCQQHKVPLLPPCL